jgi:protein-tyrosine phosphatase
MKLMLERGIDISAHRATQISRPMCLQADLLLVMDGAQRRYLEELYPQACGRIFRLGEHAKRDIPDPYRQGSAAFRGALSLIEDGVREWQHRIQKI